MKLFFAALLVALVDPAVALVGLVAALCWREGWRLGAVLMIVGGALALTAAMGSPWLMTVARAIAASAWAALIVFLMNYWKRRRPQQ